MIKPERLRELLTQTIDTFKANPDKLILQFNKGKISTRGNKSHSFEYQYDLKIIAVDFPYHPDVLFVPILIFIRKEQWELLQKTDNWEKIEFEIDRNNNETYDISVKIPLTERIVVKEEDGHFISTHADEPEIAYVSPIKHLTEFEAYLQDELIYNWKENGE